MVPGDLGTKGGIVTDVDGRALREGRFGDRGLYAAGNTSAPVMGHTYAGPGATIGPALVFGYLAALDIATKAGVRSVLAERTQLGFENLLHDAHRGEPGGSAAVGARMDHGLDDLGAGEPVPEGTPDVAA